MEDNRSVSGYFILPECNVICAGLLYLENGINVHIAKELWIKKENGARIFEQMKKKYVDVEVLWTKEGSIIPDAIIWESAQGKERYEITKIISGPITMKSLAGGVGKRYEILIGKSKRYLFREKDKWFIESEK